MSPKLPCHTSELRTMNNKKGLVRKPQPVRLSGVDSVFGRVITAQPPKWTGTFKSFRQVSLLQNQWQNFQWPTGLRNSDSDDSDHVQTDVTLHPLAVSRHTRSAPLPCNIPSKGSHLIPVPNTMSFAMCLKLTQSCPCKGNCACPSYFAFQSGSDNSGASPPFPPKMGQ